VEQQADAFKACWRTDYRDNNEPHLLPAKHLAAWIDNNVYLPLAEAPSSLTDTTLNEEAGACETCPFRTGFNSLLFSDANGDMCLKAACYHSKVEAHVAQTVAARPELVQIATDWRRDDNPAVLARFAYNSIEPDEEESEPQHCEHTREAIVAFGEDAGTTRTICTDKECPIHGPRRKLKNYTRSPEQIEAEKQLLKEQKARQTEGGTTQSHVHGDHGSHPRAAYLRSIPFADACPCTE
jgi:ParB family chromosome partitioning protein